VASVEQLSIAKIVRESAEVEFTLLMQSAKKVAELNEGVVTKSLKDFIPRIIEI